MAGISKYLRLYQHIAISIGMIIIVIIGVLLGIIPGIQKIISIRNQSLELSKSLQILRTKVSILESKDEMTFRDEFAQLVAAVPQDKSLPTLFATLDGLAAQSGVTLMEFSLAKLGSIASSSAGRKTSEEVKIGTNLLPFTITVNGSYEQIYTFLSQVNQVRRFFRVRNFDISFSDMTAISVRMGMDAFYAPIASTIGSVESPLEPLSQKEETLITSISRMPYLGQSAIIPLPAVSLPSEPRSNLFAP